MVEGWHLVTFGGFQHAPVPDDITLVTFDNLQKLDVKICGCCRKKVVFGGIDGDEASELGLVVHVLLEAASKAINDIIILIDDGDVYRVSIKLELRSHHNLESFMRSKVNIHFLLVLLQDVLVRDNNLDSLSFIHVDLAKHKNNHGLALACHKLHRNPLSLGCKHISSDVTLILHGLKVTILILKAFSHSKNPFHLYS